MKTNLILASACQMLSEDELASKLKLEERSLTEDETKKVNDLLKCLNFILNEVATEYCPMLFKEEILIDDGKFDLTLLSKTFAYVKSLKSDGVNVSYKIYGDNLIANEERATIEYCYIPDEANLDEEIEIYLPARVFAYGVLREYYLLQDLSTEASLFEERFKNSLVVFSRKKSAMRMPKRIWK